MGRLPKIRVNYQADAVFLTNLSRAIENDERRSPEWKKEALSHLQSLVSLFLQDAADQLKSRAK